MLLQIGSAGNEVTMLQSALQALGHMQVNIDGVFGPITQDAVMRFQQSDGRQPTGVVDDTLYGRMQQILGMLIVNRSGLDLPVIRAPYIPTVTPIFPGVVPGLNEPVQYGTTQYGEVLGPFLPTASYTATGNFSTAMLFAVGILGVTLYVVSKRRG